MANIPETPEFSADVYQIETTDKVLGGPDGVINLQAKQLADRTAFLKDAVESAADVAAGADAKAGSALAQIADVELAAGSAAGSAASALQYKDDALAAKALAELAQRTAAEDAASAAAAAAGAAADRVQAGQLATEAGAAASAAVQAASQSVSERNQVVILGEQKKSEITALADASLVQMDEVRDETISAKDVAVEKAQEATTQAGIATDQASVASGQANIATTQAGIATTAKNAAEAARDAAQLSAGVYATTAAGLAATTNGKYFSVPSAESREFLILYQNSSGTAVEVKRYPSVNAVAGLQQTSIPGVAISFEDAAGYAAAGLLDDGMFFAEKASVGSLTIDSPTANKLTIDTRILDTTPNPAEFTVEDSYGFSVFAVREDGTAAARNFQCEAINEVPFAQILAGSGGGSAAFVSAENFDAEIVMLISYGQSNSVGTDGQPALTTSQAYDNLSFAGGVRPGDLAVGSPLGSFIPLVERDKPNTTNKGETPIGGATIAIKDLVSIENGIAYTQQTYQLLGVANGSGGSPIANLEKGTGSYNTLLSHVTAAKAVAQSLNKTFKVGAVFWTQGESDTDGVAYLTKFKQLQIDLDTDIKAITKQQTTVPVISFAVDAQSSLAVKLAQIQASDENQNIHIACPGYPLKTGTHFNNVGFKRLGAYYGLAYKRIVIDKTGWKPLRPVDFLVQDDLLQIKFSTQHKPLVVATTPIGVNYTSSGFSLTDASGNAIAITGITIVNGDMVKIQAATTIPAGAKITYEKGNLRDSQGDTLVFGGGLNFPLHNWCVTFQQTL